MSVTDWLRRHCKYFPNLFSPAANGADSKKSVPAITLPGRGELIPDWLYCLISRRATRPPTFFDDHPASMNSAITYSESPLMFKANPLGFLGCLLLIPAAGIGLLILLYWYVAARTTKFTITDREVLFEKGILNKEHSEIALASVPSVKVKQSLLNRMFDVGTVEIYTAGDNPEIVASGLPTPKKVRDLIN